ncbi:EAL domain-containing protein [Shewanella sp.]|uniref:EAL domain-containing protein n=1 Tax=Shewanella sp. TaxID=50422 RepID=UPI00345D55E3
MVKALHNSLGFQLQKAVKKGELSAYYQPIIDAITGYVVGAEALVRWIKPDSLR